LSTLIRRGLWTLLSVFLFVTLSVGAVILYLESRLPDVDSLKNVQLQVPLRIYTNDNQLIAEYGDKRRIPVSLGEIPKPLIQAVLATEDQRFFEHSGVDFLGLARASLELVKTGERSQGGSTITMQLARNFYLSPEKTYMRKLNEILLAIKIDSSLPKDKVLELYLNLIYFGSRSYGVAAAAQVYFGKELHELTLAEMAMLAGIPKAPSKINPLANHELALKRRNHVLARMLEVGAIDQGAYKRAIAEPLVSHYHGTRLETNAPYAAEMIRISLLKHFGEDIYTKGYEVHTTLNSRLQKAANNALMNSLIAYDMRHGYRGAEQNLSALSSSRWPAVLQTLPPLGPLQPAVITQVGDKSITALLGNKKRIELVWSGIEWIRPRNGDVRSVLKTGDVIRVTQVKDEVWQLRQLPTIEGALVALSPHDGSIQAIVGGLNFRKSRYNRATQSIRQPGSAFKPFIYAAALDKGYTLATVINDAPLVIHDTSLEGDEWRPSNDTGEFGGPTRLHEALVRSVNLVSIRILQGIGINYTLKFLQRFGFDPSTLPHGLSLALGSATVSPLELAGGYATFANGGYQVQPFLIERIVDPKKNIIYQAKPRTVCDDCDSDPVAQKLIPEDQRAERTVDARTIYLTHLMMRDVILRGTAVGAKVLNRNDIAGKTGTNEDTDLWFAGYNSDLVATTWVGFDTPQALHEYGWQAALPIWIEFMRVALANKPEHPLPEPPGLVSVRIDPKTGLVASADQKNAIFETFREDNQPTPPSASIEAPEPLGPDGMPMEAPVPHGDGDPNQDPNQLY
jgi:penicillin-binding protein 1A